MLQTEPEIQRPPEWSTVELRQRPNILTKPTPTNLDPVEIPPDGGLQAWMQVFGSFMIFLNIWGFTFVFGVFQSYYELSYLPKSSAFDISWIGTIQSSLLVMIGVLAGPLFDLGAYRIMLVSGAFLCVFGLMMLSLSTAYYQIFLSQGICVGIGGGLLYVPCLALVGGSFSKKRAIALGIVTCGIGLGGVVYVVAFEQLLPRLGFAWTVRTLAFIALGVFLLSIPTLFTSTSRKTKSVNGSSPTSRQLIDIAALHDPLFLTFALSSFLIFLGYLVPFFYIPAYAQVSLSLSKSLAFYALAVSSAASILGRLAAAFAAHYLGAMLPWISCTVLSGALCLIWTRITTTATFFAFCALYGFFSGALVALPPTVFPHICTDSKKLGTWMGMGWLFSGLAFLVGSPIAGALTKVGVDNSHQPQQLNFLPVQLWSGTLLLAGAAVLGCLWRLLVVKRGTKLWI